MNILDKEKIGQIIRFGVVGVGATVLHYIVFNLLLNLFGKNLSFALAYMFSFIFNFILSNYFTFKTNPNKEGGVKFLLAHTFNFFLQMLLLNMFSGMMNPRIAMIPTYAISIPINFLLVKKALVAKK